MSFSEWREVKVSEIGKIVTGKTPKTAISENYGGNIPFLTPSDDMNIKKVKSTARTLSEMGLNSVKNCLLPAKSICVSCIGSVLGKVVLTSEPTVTNQQINSIVPDEKFDPDFIYYGMTILGKHLNYLSKTSTAVPIINKTTFSNFSIIVPTIEEQKAIAHILSTLDDKIEVNNQINKTLENMAQAIFKQWFVDFEFPNEEGEPYKSSGGEMFESELGMIPKGWEVKKSSDIANVNIGKTPPRKEKECFTLDPDDYKWISIKDLGNSGAYIFDSSEYLTKESIEKYNVKVVPDNTVVLSFKLTIGRVSITCGQMTTNEAIAHFNLSNKSKITTEYLYLYLKGFDYGKLGNTSSIANAVNSKIIKSMPIIVPDNKTIKTFSEVMESVFSKIKYTIKQSDKLIEIRDSLLPKLMSGEIRVPLDEEGIVS
ncbi:MAG: restriction endonuclease subunit S [Bacteroides sp.]|nr:restriction endonuclease subunit S [Bacteroides sp.]